MSVDPDQLADLASSLARQAGYVLLEGLDRTRTSVSTKTSTTDMVTEMDRASEMLLVTGILESRPHDAVLAEEGTSSEGSTGVRWIIDPLDGTTNYLYGHPGFAVSIAAEYQGDIVAGVVYDPMADDMYRAVKGGGATRNGIAINTSGQTELPQALVATGFSYDPSRRIRQVEVLTTMIDQVRDIRRMGAAAMDLCSVACGRVDAFYEMGLQPWDYSAGALIAREAGAVVGDLNGGPASGQFCLAASAGIFEQIRLILNRAGAAKP